MIFSSTADVCFQLLLTPVIPPKIHIPMCPLCPTLLCTRHQDQRASKSANLVVRSSYKNLHNTRASGNPQIRFSVIVLKIWISHDQHALCCPPALMNTSKFTAMYQLYYRSKFCQDTCTQVGNASSDEGFQELSWMRTKTVRWKRRSSYPFYKT